MFSVFPRRDRHGRNREQTKSHEESKDRTRVRESQVSERHEARHISATPSARSVDSLFDCFGVWYGIAKCSNGIGLGLIVLAEYYIR
eukprot:3342371-Prymnesium_polylepis.1